MHTESRADLTFAAPSADGRHITVPQVHGPKCYCYKQGYNERRSFTTLSGLQASTTDYFAKFDGTKSDSLSYFGEVRATSGICCIWPSGCF